jgi:hypothetical protein
VATQLLIYENAVPVSRARHGKWSVEVGADYGFCRNVNSVPLMAVEMPQAAREYPIVFAGSGEQIMPAVILGLRGNENLYLKADGRWDADYTPAFVRRYPFVFSSAENGAKFTLCIDESFSGFNQAGKGARLFDDEGKASVYVENVLKFLQEYQNQFRVTQAFCKHVSSLGLLEPMQAEVTLASGEKSSLAGFMAVNRDKLKALSGEQFAALAKTDELELLYLHVQSLRNFERLKNRLAAVAKAA